MGQKLAKKAFGHAVVRPIQNYDAENRAMKEISRTVPKMAPPHPSMQKVMDDIRKDPQLLLKKAKIDPKLAVNLKQVFITSAGDNPIVKQDKSSLPQSRVTPEEFEYGFLEPDKVTPGKASFKQILELLANHATDPEVYTAEKLAKDNNLKLEDVKDLLQYYKPFSMYTPKEKPKQSAFMRAIKA